MKTSFALLLFAMSASATAQTADAIYKQACGPKDVEFVVQQVQEQAPTAPEPGKALVFFVQKETLPIFITRVGLDGAWVGVLQHASYIFASVAPGEHHACVATQDRKNPGPELVHFTAEAGKVYYYLVRGIAGGGEYGSFATTEFGPADRDEALFLIASDPMSVSKPKQ
jgi:hypothetical protein